MRIFSSSPFVKKICVLRGNEDKAARTRGDRIIGNHVISFSLEGLSDSGIVRV